MSVNSFPNSASFLADNRTCWLDVAFFVVMFFTSVSMLCNCPDGFLMLFSCTEVPHALGRQIESVRKYQF